MSPAQLTLSALGRWESRLITESMITRLTAFRGSTEKSPSEQTRQGLLGQDQSGRNGLQPNSDGLQPNM